MDVEGLDILAAFSLRRVSLSGLQQLSALSNIEAARCTMANFTAECFVPCTVYRQHLDNVDGRATEVAR